MNKIELVTLASNWIKYWHALKGSTDRELYADATNLYELQYDEPETLWALILEIHRQDKSIPIQQLLSAGPVEDLLAQHGEAFIDKVETEARKDPTFAKLLGGVWQNKMSDVVWKRL